MTKRHSKRKKRRRGTEELAPIDEQRYAQPEEEEKKETSLSPEGGVLRVNTGSLSIPDEIEAEAGNRKSQGANMVLIVIVTFMLAFIAVIAWLISRSSQ